MMARYTHTNYHTNYTCTNAVLLLFFNRSDTTRATLAQIAKVKPPRIYLACDGPRSSQKAGKEAAQEVTKEASQKAIKEAAIIEQLRHDVLSSIDWECEIYTRFLDENLGCKHAVSSAISWFFSHEVQGIILEDDCLPALSFFRFCDELLDRYADNEQIMMVSGFSALGFCQATQEGLESSYYFSRYNHIWGWASWRRAWQCYTLEQQDFMEKFRGFCFTSAEERAYWQKIFRSYYAGEIDTWDYPWTFSIWAAGGLCIYPKYNMISNIGFNRADATHTTGESRFSRMHAHEIAFPLIHPQAIEQNPMLDGKDFLLAFAKDPMHRRVIQKLQTLWKLLRRLLGSLFARP